MIKDLTIVVQGPFTKWTADFIKRYWSFPFVKDVILSTWINYEEESRGYDRVLSCYPENHGKGNRNLQIISSIAGIECAETEFCLKVRSDFFLQNLVEMYNDFKREFRPTQIRVLSLYPRFAFHPRDHIFLGTTHDLHTLFSIPLDKETLSYNEYVDLRSEAYIGVHYYRNFDARITKFIDEPHKYLTDNSPYRVEALDVYHNLIRRRLGFWPFKEYPVEFPKYYPDGYPFEHLKHVYGEAYQSDLEESWLV